MKQFFVSLYWLFTHSGWGIFGIILIVAPLFCWVVLHLITWAESAGKAIASIPNPIDRASFMIFLAIMAHAYITAPRKSA